jgi:hypothetical protein
MMLRRDFLRAAFGLAVVAPTAAALPNLPAPVKAPAASATVVAWDTAPARPLGLLDHTRLTIPTTGFYQMTAVIKWNSAGPPEMHQWIEERPIDDPWPWA